MRGNTRPEARAEFDRGSVEPQLAMGDLFLVLRRSPERQAAFEAFLASQQDPASPNYHRWLAPEQVGEQFGPAQADIDTVSNWLRNHGFTITEVSKDRMTIRFDGVASQVQSTFHTEIHNLAVRGESHIANMTDPMIPEALTPVVVGVNALHNFFPRPQHVRGSAVRRNADGTWERISNPASGLSRPVPAAADAKQMAPYYGTGGTPAAVEDIAPYDFATIYNVLPLWKAATPIDGTGETIAVAGTSNINPADIVTFRSAFGLPAGKTPIFYTGNTDPGDCPTFANSCAGDLVENTLDVEWSGAVAPGAQIILVGSSAVTASTDSLLVSEQFIVNNTNGKINAKVMNVSYGECELGLGTASNTLYSNLWSTAQANGIAVFVSTGDAGASTCDQGFDQQSGVPYGAQFGLSVSGLSTTPYNVAVGGTDFLWGWVNSGQTTYWNSTNNSSNTSNAKGYIPEMPWNSTCANYEFVASENAANKSKYTAEQWCDGIGDGAFNFGANEQLFQSTVDTVGGGGGASNCIDGDSTSVASCTKGYAKPAFQSGVTGIPNDGVRDVPDVSFFAASGFSGSAYVVCVSAAGTCSYTQGTEPSGEEYGGTSISSPAMAGVMALINQKAGSTQGNPNTALYKLAAAETYSGCSSSAIPLSGSKCIFNDINTGSNAMPCAAGTTDCPNFSGEVQYSVLSGWSATTGYDLATGLGSINVANLVNTFAPASTAPTVTLTPTSLTFGGTNVGVAAPTQSVVLKNSGTAALTISGISVTGTDASSFTQTNDCPASVAISGTCTIIVTFKPTASGTLTAAVSIADNASGSPQSIALTGAGNAAASPGVTFTPTSLTFPSTVAGVAAPTQAVTLKNTGSAVLTISGISVTGTNASSFTQVNTCGGSVAIGASCTITVTYTPTTFTTAGNSLTASISVADNATGSPQTVALTGTATEAGSYSLAATNVTISSAGGSGTSTVTATVTTGYDGSPITLTCSVAPISGGTATPTCSVSGPINVTAANPVATTVNIATTAPSTTAAPVRKPVKAAHAKASGVFGSGWFGAGCALLVCSLLLAIPARRRELARWRSMLSLLVFVAAIGAFSGCSSGGGGKTTVAGTTPDTYTVTVSGTDAAGVKQSTTFTATVQ